MLLNALMRPPKPTKNHPLHHPAFPRSNAYDPNWVLANEMGPNALWLTEYLVEAVDIRPGMCVLDLACGKALSSIFLAEQYGVTVHAVDLWIDADDNLKRITACELGERIIPLQAEATGLPFEPERFDAIISIDAFEYFGLETGYLASILPLLKPGGQIGIVNAGVIKDVSVMPSSWPEDFANFRSADWWRAHWQDVAEVECADNMEGARDLWMLWNDVTNARDDDWIRGAAGENLTFNRIVARRPK